jgi:hypothetical protein
MTPEEFLKFMRLIFEYGCCPEENHVAAEIMMCDVLEELGYGEGVKIFKESIGCED